MQLEDLTKSNIVTVLGLGLLTVAATELVPSLRPALKSAIKLGLAILEESEIEAEAELIRFLAVSTFAAIDEVLARPDDEAKRRAAVRRRIRHFQRQARSRAECWSADEHERYRCCRRHVAQLQAHLVEKKRQVGPRRQRIIDDASIFLAQEIG